MWTSVGTEEEERPKKGRDENGLLQLYMGLTTFGANKRKWSRHGYLGMKKFDGGGTEGVKVGNLSVVGKMF